MPRVGQRYSADDVREMAESGICEPSRLLHIRGMIEAGRPLYNSDRAYLDRIASRLADKEAALRRENRRISRVLGAGPRAKGAVARPVPPPAPDPAPAVIDAGHTRPAPASPSPAAGRRHDQGQGSADQAASRGGPLREKGAPTSPSPAPAAPSNPPAAPAPEARRTLIDDDAFDAILERRDRRRHSEARERAVEAAAPCNTASPSAPPACPPRSEDRAAKAGPPTPTIAGRIKGIVAGRR